MKEENYDVSRWGFVVVPDEAGREKSFFINPPSRGNDFSLLKRVSVFINGQWTIDKEELSRFGGFKGIYLERVLKILEDELEGILERHQAKKQFDYYYKGKGYNWDSSQSNEWDLVEK